jgi:uncharacterized protein (TIGR00369 family)
MKKSDLFEAPPNFLKILGSEGYDYDEENESISMKFNLTSDFAHTLGTIIQGGFITAMLDASMGHVVTRKYNGDYNSATLSLNVHFLRAGEPGSFEAIGKINKLGRSIVFTSSELFQNGKLVATATASNMLIPLDE